MDCLTTALSSRDCKNLYCLTKAVLYSRCKNLYCLTKVLSYKGCKNPYCLTKAVSYRGCTRIWIVCRRLYWRGVVRILIFFNFKNKLFFSVFSWTTIYTDIYYFKDISQWFIWQFIQDVTSYIYTISQILHEIESS